jgi:hypothetical protein
VPGLEEKMSLKIAGDAASTTFLPFAKKMNRIQ